jgi:hypothetical protein
MHTPHHPKYSTTGEPVMVGDYISGYDIGGSFKARQGRVSCVGESTIVLREGDVVSGLPGAHLRKMSDNIVVPGFGMKRADYAELKRVVERLPFEATSADEELLYLLARSIVDAGESRDVEAGPDTEAMTPDA